MGDGGKTAVNRLYTRRRRVTLHLGKADPTACRASQCRTRMAKVEYSFPVDKIHGRISKSHQVGFAHRTASKLNYTTTYGKRSTPVSDDEKQYRTYWGQVASAVAQRMKDPTKQPQDQLNFKNQNEYDTLRKYVWHLCAEEINNA